ncbi:MULTISPECIES: tetratricopeptide repeat-containing diguanylate cyclase [Shewanella]|uniref:tetratricopeptide repeat-containing diguanylate cyclase n=1 Tax=Shewanella TaxID=22 RepID=UPI001C7D2F72|nr:MULTISPECIES: GGDEF domain-containing protein [Shewanella]
MDILLVKRWRICLFGCLFVLSASGFAKETLLELQKTVAKVSPAEAVVLLDKFDITSSGFSPEEQAQVYFLYGQAYEKTRQLNQAINSYDKGIALVKYLPVSDILIDSHLERSFALYLQSNDPITYCVDRKLALEYARKHTNSELLAKTLTQNAFCFIEPDTVYKGIDLLDEALLVVDKSENLNVNRKALIYNATGSLYRRVGLHQRGYENFKIAYETWKTINDIEDMFNMQHNMLSQAIKLGDWGKAEESIQQQFELARVANGEGDLLFFSHLNAGQLALRTYDFTQAAVHLEKALLLQDTTREQYFITSTYLYLALAYTRSGDLNKAAEMARIFRLDDKFPANMKDMMLKADAIIALAENEPVKAANLFLQVVDIERENNQSIIDSKVLTTSLDHNIKLAAFENELLENRLAINELNWAAVEDKERISDLRLTLFLVLAVVLFGIVLILLHSRKTLKERAQTDYLTGLSNRGYTFQKGQKIIDRAIRKRQPASVIIFDIDNFKSINDRFGHHIGDLAIKAAAKRARSWLKKTDLVGRIGGEEFLIILDNTNLDEAFTISDRLRNGIASQSFHFDGIDVEFTISLGVATLDSVSTTLADLSKHADDALYQAKYSGKNKVYLAKQCA